MAPLTFFPKGNFKDFQFLKSNSKFNPNKIIGKYYYGSTFPTKAKVVICGGGAVGNSVAYHLVKNNWKDIVVLEQNKIGSGVTWRGCGIVGHFHPAYTAKIHGYSAQLYRTLQEEGHNVKWITCGAVDLARTKDRMIALKRLATEARVQGLECEVLGPTELKKIHPLINTNDIQGGVWIPSDGFVDPLAVCQVLANIAKKEGAQYFESCKVQRLESLPSSPLKVHTSEGVIEAEYVVLCTGLWSRQIGLASHPQFRMPVHAALHAHVLTEPINGISNSLPIMRDYDGRIFSRYHDRGLLIGGFKKVSKPIMLNEIPDPFVFKKFAPDWEHFNELYLEAKLRHPILKEIPVKELINGPDTFTPDGHWILGETPEVDNLFVGVGMLGNSVQSAGGIGKLLSEWIIKGAPGMFVLPFDVKRFIDLHNNHRFLQERIKESVGFRFAIPHPFQFECHTARKLRCSPLYPLHDAAGAVFGERMGFERALYFDPSQPREQRLCPPHPTFHKPPWFDRVHEEYLACREQVGVIDMSSFSKFIIKSASSKDVVAYLQYLCSNDIDIPVGHILSTGMQNSEGGFENDCLLLRKSQNCYFMMSPTAQLTRLSEWMQRFLPKDGSVAVDDVTSMYTVLNVVGPKSRELLRELTRNPEFNIPTFHCQEMNVGYSGNVLVMGFNNTGEPGYSLYIPSEYALHIFNRLMTVGKDYGIKNVGYYALRFLRIEKFIPFWGEELDSHITPFEIGRASKVKLQKANFLGKEALQAQHENGVQKRLVHFQLESNHNPDVDLWPWGSEPIFRNGQYVGMTTSSGYGFTLGKVVCLGFIHHHDPGKTVTTDYVTRNARYEIEIAGEKFPVRASLHPPNIPVMSMAGTAMRYVPKPRVKLSTS